MNKLSFVALAVICLAVSACESESPISAYDINGSYVLYDNPYSDGYAEVEARPDNKVYLDVTTFTPGAQGICQWEGEVAPTAKPTKAFIDENREKYVEISFGDDTLKIDSNSNEMCGMGTSLEGMFLKVDSPAYNEAIGATSPLPPFENIIDGNLISYQVDKDKYTLEMDLVVDTYTISGRTSDPLFAQIERTMKWAKIYNENALPEHSTVALLQNEGVNCGFIQIRSEEIYLRNFNARPDKIIVDMCIAETSDCGSLRVSQNNPIFYQAETFLAHNLEQVVDATFSTGGEILSMNVRQHALHGSWVLDIDKTIEVIPALKQRVAVDPSFRKQAEAVLNMRLNFDMETNTMVWNDLAKGASEKGRFQILADTGNGNEIMIKDSTGRALQIKIIDSTTMVVKDSDGFTIVFRREL